MIGDKVAENAAKKTNRTQMHHSEKEILMMARAAGEFAKKLLTPDRQDNDTYPFGPLFIDVVEKAFDLDFFHILLPEQLDGMNQGITALSAVLERICREDSSLGGIIFTVAAAQDLMLQAGNEQTLKAICAGETMRDFLIGLPVFNNPSEVNHLAEARRTKDGYHLSGALEYLVLGDLARQAIVPAKVKDEQGFSFFLVDLDDEGVRKSPPILSLGLHGCPAVDVFFDGVNGLLLGQPGIGNVYFEKMADRMHAAAAAMSLGIMKGAFQEALDYAVKREQGGQKIIRWSEIKMMLANMALKINNAEMILAQAVQAVDSQTPNWQLRTRAAALHIQEMACDVTTDGIQVLGGVGYMKDFGQEKRFRDAKHLQTLLGIVPLRKLKFIDAFLNLT